MRAHVVYYIVESALRIKLNSDLNLKFRAFKLSFTLTFQLQRSDYYGPHSTEYQKHAARTR